LEKVDTNLIAYKAQRGVHWNAFRGSFSHLSLKEEAVSLIINGGMTIAEVGRSFERLATGAA